MIIQLNWVRTDHDREVNNRTYLHYGPGCPNDDELLDFISNHYGFSDGLTSLSKDSYGDMLYCLSSRPVAVVWPVFCTYQEGEIIDPRFKQVNYKKSINLREERCL